MEEAENQTLKEDTWCLPNQRKLTEDDQRRSLRVTYSPSILEKMQDKEGPGLSSEDHTKAFLHLTHSSASHDSHALSVLSMALQNIFQHPLPVPVTWASLITCYISGAWGWVEEMARSTAALPLFL